MRRVDVSQSFLIVDYWETMYNINRFVLQEMERFPQRTPNMRNIIFLTDIVSAYTETLRKY